MTWKELIGIVFIMVAAFLGWRLLRKLKILRAAQDKIYQDEIDRVLEKITADITPSLLEQYGFKIYDTKSEIYALYGPISMTQKEGYWETEIQAPGKVLWRDTHDQIGQLLIFCEKHGLELTKQDEG